MPSRGVVTLAWLLDEARRRTLRPSVVYERAGRVSTSRRRARPSVHALPDEVDELLEAGHVGARMTLAGDDHRRAETALNRIEDSAGRLTDSTRYS